MFEKYVNFIDIYNFPASLTMFPTFIYTLITFSH